MQVLSRLMRAFIKARTRSVLSGLSDQQLADIGIHRSGIRAHVESIYED